MDKVRKISKAKGVEICADLLYAGRSRKEILLQITESYKASDKTVDNWLKEARVVVAERQAVANVVRDRVDKEEAEASAKRLNLTRERVLEEYAKIAFFDIRTIFTVDGGLKPIHELGDEAAGAIAGIETIEEKTTVKEDDKAIDSITQGVSRKIKITEKTKALDSICRVLGYNAPTKTDITSNGHSITTNVIIEDPNQPSPSE